MTRKLEKRIEFLEAVVKTGLLNDQIVKLKDGSVFFVPNYLEDAIQGGLYLDRDYYEIGLLEELKSYLPREGVFLDVGSNIGNHAIY